MKDIAIFGAGGFGREVACLINSINRAKPQWNLLGFFDDVKPKGSKNEFGPILGGLNDLNSYIKPLSLVMSIGEPSAVSTIVSKITNPFVEFPNLIAPDILLMDEKSFSMGKGNLFMFQALVSYNVGIGDFNLFNVGVSLGHGSKMGSFNSMMSYTKISGDVVIGDLNYFGICSVVLQKIQIGNNTTIGANSVLMRNTKDCSTYFGNPAVEILKPRTNK